MADLRLSLALSAQSLQLGTDPKISNLAAWRYLLPNLNVMTHISFLGSINPVGFLKQAAVCLLCEQPSCQF
jgi:hypothetical protein